MYIYTHICSPVQCHWRDSFKNEFVWFVEIPRLRLLFKTHFSKKQPLKQVTC